MKNLIHIIAVAFLFTTVSCKKTAGEGGDSSITGKILVETRLVLTNPLTIQSTLPALDEDVYIIYGDHISPDNKIETNYNGEFEFRNLRPGKYSVYVYSNDTLGINDKMFILKEVTINGKEESIDLGEITIYED